MVSNEDPHKEAARAHLGRIIALTSDIERFMEKSDSATPQTREEMLVAVFKQAFILHQGPLFSASTTEADEITWHPV